MDVLVLVVVPTVNMPAGLLFDDIAAAVWNVNMLAR
jgi:hypothetical protein